MEEREAPAPRPRRYARHDPNAFQVGQVVSRSFTVWAKSVVTLLLLSSFAMAPMLAWTGYRVATGAVQHSPFTPHGPGRSEHRVLVEVATSVVETLVGWVCGALANAMVVFAVFRRLRDEQPSFAESIRGGLRRLPAVVGVILLSAVVYYGPPAAVLGVVAAAGADGAVLLVVGILVGLAWIVPLFWLVLSWWVAVPAIVIERPGVIGALGRSMRLTRGHRWHILLLILLIAGIGMGVGIVGGVLVFASPAAALVVLRVVAVLLASLNGTFVAVTYHDLRREKEGTPADEMAQVFA